MHIAITGCTGVLGSILISTLKKESDISIHTFRGDISIQSEVEYWISSINIDYLFHFAALVPVDAVNNDPFRAYQVNAGGTMNLLAALKKYNKKPWLFYASTSHVYKSSNDAIDEKSTIEPINTYGKTKYMGELFCETYSSSHNLQVCIGRIFSFYHKIQKKPFLYPSIMERLEKEDLSKPFELKGGKNIRDLSDAEAIISSIIKLMNKKVGGVVNIGSGNGITIEDFVQHISPRKLVIVSDDSPPNSLVANISRLNSIVNG